MESEPEPSKSDERRRSRPAGLLQLCDRLLDDLAPGRPVGSNEVGQLEPAVESYLADAGLFGRRRDGRLGQEGCNRLLLLTGQLFAVAFHLLSSAFILNLSPD